MVPTSRARAPPPPSISVQTGPSAHLPARLSLSPAPEQKNMLKISETSAKKACSVERSGRGLSVTRV